MKILRSLLMPLALLAVGAAFAAEAPLLPFEAGAPAATHPSMYSFADVYRLTLTGEPFGGFRFVDSRAQIRFASQAGVSAEPSESVAELRFSVSPPRERELWMLGLAGIFACAWVAHRRLVSPY
jgi:hypothetical protein